MQFTMRRNLLSQAAKIKQNTSLNHLLDLLLLRHSAATATAATTVMGKKKSTASNENQQTLTSMFKTASPSKKRERDDAEGEAEVTADSKEVEKQTIAATAASASSSSGVVVEEEGAAAVLVEAKKAKKGGSEFIKEEGWRALLATEMSKDYFDKIFRFLASEEKAGKIVFPPRAEVFHAFESCPFEKTRVVIIGQDPYHGAGQAHGLCFSVKKGVPIPPSLKNIYKEAVSDVKIPMPTHGFLDCWSEQGVLLLNTVMTVRQAEPNSHKDQGWETFTDAVIKLLSSKKENLVFLLWGKPAQAKVKLIANAKLHHIIKSSHPSPLGANSSNEPFIGSKCFSRANKYLEDHKLDPIDWKVI